MKYFLILFAIFISLTVSASDYKRIIKTIEIETFYSENTDMDYFRIINDTKFRLRCYTYNYISIEDKGKKRRNIRVYTSFSVSSEDKSSWYEYPVEDFRWRCN